MLGGVRRPPIDETAGTDAGGAGAAPEPGGCPGLVAGPYRAEAIAAALAKVDAALGQQRAALKEAAE